MQKFKMEFIKLVSFLVVFGVVLFFKFGVGVFATSAKIHAKNAMHSGWDGARAELRKSFEKELGTVELSATVKKELLDCMVQKAIDYLNQTTCSYQYNKFTTSAQAHVKEQDECIKASGYGEAMDKQFEACVDDALKNNP